jgi:hypothetical protein
MPKNQHVVPHERGWAVRGRIRRRNTTRGNDPTPPKG